MTNYKTPIPAAVLEYLEYVEQDKAHACKEQIAFCEYVRGVFERESLIVETARLEKYLRLAKYFRFKALFPWEKMLNALWLCVYRLPGVPRWKTAFVMVGRGAGKDGEIAFSSFCLMSPYNPVSHYNVDICANNEEQATTPCKDLAEALENPRYEAKLVKHYYHTKEIIQGRKNKGVMKGRTNNPKGRDGMRSGAVIFNEVHAYENYDNIKVFITGQGKVAEPRVGLFTSNGEVSDGPLDDYLARGRRILFEGEADNGFLPFICCLNDKRQVHDPANWKMANPSLPYLPDLQREIEDEYRDWLEHPEQNGDFLTKRMGIRAGVKEISVTEYENIKATNKPLPDMTGWSCTVGIDAAEISDWAAVNFHFRRGEERYDINHAWMCRNSRDVSRIKAPWQAWAEAGSLTVVDDVSIKPSLIAEYIRSMGKKYVIKMVAMDSYRVGVFTEALAEAGINVGDKTRVKLVRPSDIMKTDQIIQECFNRQLFTWGDVPHLRWAVNNTKRWRTGKTHGVETGNYIYAKIEPKSRKTDPFMALVHSMAVEEALGSGKPVKIPDQISFIF